MATRKKQTTLFPTYKNKPLVRCGDTLYYGSMADPYVIQLTIKEKKSFNDMKIPSKVSIKLMSTDITVSPNKQVLKSAEKESLYEALDIADAWLARGLSQEQK